MADVHARITRDPIDPDSVRRRVGSAEDGAAILFVGVVRNHNAGRPVAGVRYDAYAEMAERVLAAIAEEAGRLARTDRIAVEHRIGELRIGDASVAIAVSSPHRAEAFEACRYVIEQIKVRLPVWKEERYTDGAARWLEGVTPRPAAPEDA